MRLREPKWLHKGCRLGKWQSQDLKASLSNVRSCALLDTTEHREKWDKGNLNFGVFFMTSHSKIIFSVSTETNSMKRKRALRPVLFSVEPWSGEWPAGYWSCLKLPPKSTGETQMSHGLLENCSMVTPWSLWEGLLGVISWKFWFGPFLFSILDDYLSLLKSHRLPTSGLTNSNWPFDAWDGLWW